jgi:fatty acid desaturase
MIVDYSFWIGSVLLMISFCNSASWNQLEFWQRWIATLLFWNFAGFFMWCIFVVGHDCGHTTFSDYKVLNDIIGHFTHGSILVPYHPWQVKLFSSYCSTSLSINALIDN